MEHEERLKAALADHYQIEREIGSGGMATVYLAQDLKHKRQVAVKVLDPSLAEVLGSERFLREIEVAANLTHPHILPVHDSGKTDGFLFYVMPYVEGESLRNRLEREKQLPVDDAVRITREIASALAFAHGRGVIHRDVKPANILLEAGHAVLADFGVAQALAEADESKLTGTGVSLGTPAYMSPEQAAGEGDLDGRSDQYALACVAYEMLSGEPPHTGSTVQAVVAKVLSTDPQALSQARRSVPGNVEASIHKALEKVPGDRFPSTIEFAAALGDPTFATFSGPARPEGRIREAAWRGWAISATVLAGILTLVAGLSISRLVRDFAQGGSAGPSIRLPLTIPGYRGGDQAPVRFIPDCSGLVYHRDGSLVLWRLDGQTASPIQSEVNPLQLMISQDGGHVAFFQGQSGSLWTWPIQGGRGVEIAEAAGSGGPEWYGGSWGSDGYLYYTPDGSSGIHRIHNLGGDSEPITTLDHSAGELDHRFPHLLPGGQGLLFTVWYGELESAAVAVRSMDTGETTIISAGTGAQYAPTGHLLFGRADGSLQALPFDLGGQGAVGTPVTVSNELLVNSYGDARFTFCDKGVLVYQTDKPGGELFLRSQDGRERLVDAGYDFSVMKFSPDGSRLAVTRPELMGDYDIWVYDLETGVEDRITSGGNDWAMSWSPDGEYLTFFSDRAGSYSLFRKRSDGSGSAEILLDSNDNQYSPSWSPDGRWIAYHQGLTEGGAGRDLWLLPVGGGEPEPLVVMSEGGGARPAFSPDGRYVTYEAGGQVWVVDVEDRDSRWQVTVDGGIFPRWSPDGKELFYVRADQAGGEDLLLVVSVETEPTFRRLGEERIQFDLAGTGVVWGGGFDISPDGSQFAFLRRSEVLEARLQIVTNWFAELTEKVGK